jgi:UDP-GlcNAc:undecaprenyl-phosphate GlcNAc-1-phosphate transferase
MIYVYFIFLIVSNIFFLKNNSLLAKYLQLYDVPSKRKIHKNKVPVLGGCLVFFNLIIYFIFINADFLNFNISYFQNIKLFNIFFLFAFSFFFLGIIDDKIDLNPNLKLIFSIVLLSLLMAIDHQFLIKDIRSIIFDKVFYLGKFSYFFSILCILLFLNALNMFDGINLQTSIYSISIIFYLFINNIFDIFIITILVSLIFFTLLNYKNLSFLGDSGTMLIAFIFSCIFIKLYNIENKFLVEQIFLVMSLPGLDMFRLFLNRLFKKKNPFKADKNHIHHILIYRFGFVRALIIIHSLIIIPFFLISFIPILILLLIQLIIYILILFMPKKIFFN